MEETGSAASEAEPATTRDADQPRSWERPAFVGLLVGTALLYMWGLNHADWANSYYSAAAYAGSRSWKAWFFGAADPAASLTVDKPPASLWLPGLSVRMFGLNMWSLLVPQALMGVGTVALVWTTVRRWASAPAALITGVVMATAPAAALMFRFNNPEALLTLLLTAAGYTTLRGIENGRRRWAIATGVLLGVGFLTKQLQVLLVVPAYGLAWLLVAPQRVGRRILDLALGGLAMVAAAGWWVAIAELWPADSRPFIGGSQNNSVLELTLGYNGLGRITGKQVGSVGGGPNGRQFGWGPTGWDRLLDGWFGVQFAWLLPAALVCLVGGLWLTRSRPRTDIQRAGLLLWGGALLTSMAVFSYMEGIFHEYYTVVLAPPIAISIGLGGHLLWGVRDRLAVRLVAGATVGLSAWWAVSLFGRSEEWNPALRVVIGVVGVGGALLALVPALPQRVRLGFGGAACAALLIGPTAWSLETVINPDTGALVRAGPDLGTPQDRAWYGRRRPGGSGGLLDSAVVEPAVAEAINEDADQFIWPAAVAGSNRAAGFQLASRQSVMPIGGFNGTDPFPTLEQFQAMVQRGKVHWYIGGGPFGGQHDGSDSAAEIEAWATTTFPQRRFEHVTLFDLTAGGPASGN